jgi:hypothetical protein
VRIVGGGLDWLSTALPAAPWKYHCRLAPPATSCPEPRVGSNTRAIWSGFVTAAVPPAMAADESPQISVARIPHIRLQPVPTRRSSWIVMLRLADRLSARRCYLESKRFESNVAEAHDRARWIFQRLVPATCAAEIVSQPSRHATATSPSDRPRAGMRLAMIGLAAPACPILAQLRRRCPGGGAAAVGSSHEHSSQLRPDVPARYKSAAALVDRARPHRAFRRNFPGRRGRDPGDGELNRRRLSPGDLR